MVKPLFAPGRTCDRYTILKPLRHGPLVERYLAFDREAPTSRVVLACADRPGASKEGFISEAQRLAAAIPEGDAKLLRVGRHQTISWVTYEPVEAKPLELDNITAFSGMAFPGAPEAQLFVLRCVIALSIGIEIGSSLEAYAEHGFHHGDLGPSTVLIDKHRAYVLETGYRQIMGDDGNTALMDPMYRAPEQLKSGRFDERSDIYSLALILYSQVATAHPFNASDREALLRRCLEGNPTPLEEILGERPLLPRLSKVLKHALAVDPERRFQRIGSFLSPLRAMFDDFQRGVKDPQLAHDSGRRALALGETLLEDRKARATAGDEVKDEAGDASAAAAEGIEEKRPRAALRRRRRRGLAARRRRGRKRRPQTAPPAMRSLGTAHIEAAPNDAQPAEPVDVPAAPPTLRAVATPPPKSSRGAFGPRRRLLFGSALVVGAAAVLIAASLVLTRATRLEIASPLNLPMLLPPVEVVLGAPSAKPGAAAPPSPLRPLRPSVAVAQRPRHGKLPLRFLDGSNTETLCKAFHTCGKEADE